MNQVLFYFQVKVLWKPLLLIFYNFHLSLSPIPNLIPQTSLTTAPKMSTNSGIQRCFTANSRTIRINYSRMKLEPQSLFSIVFFQQATRRQEVAPAVSPNHFASFPRASLNSPTSCVYQCPQILCSIVIYNFEKFINQRIVKSDEELKNHKLARCGSALPTSPLLLFRARWIVIVVNSFF